MRGARYAFLFTLLVAPFGALGACSAGAVNDFFDPNDAAAETTTIGDAARDTTRREDADVDPDDAAVDATTKDAGKDADASTKDASDAAAADCSAVPEVKSNDGPYCFAVEDAGPDGSTQGTNCKSAQNEICCAPNRLDSGAFPPSTCIVATEDTTGYVSGSCTYASPTGTEWHCTEAAHCPGAGEKCCAIKSDAGSPFPSHNNDFPAACPAYFQSGTFVGGTRCKSTCGGGELQLCASNAECTAGKCVFIEIAGRYTGYCRL